MKISDIIVESTTEQLDQLKKEYFADKGTYNNASHKFFSIRKKLSASDSSFSTVTPAEFFNYIKGKKTQAVAEPKKQERTKLEPKELDLSNKNPSVEEQIAAIDFAKSPEGKGIVPMVIAAVKAGVKLDDEALLYGIRNGGEHLYFYVPNPSHELYNAAEEQNRWIFY